MDIIVSPLMLAINNNYDNRKQRSAAFMLLSWGYFSVKTGILRQICFTHQIIKMAALVLQRSLERDK